MNPQHATYFLNTIDEFQWNSIPIRHWINILHNNHEIDIVAEIFPEQGLSKGELLAHCQSSTYSIKEKCIMILIWGGMIGQRINNTLDYCNGYTAQTELAFLRLMRCRTRFEAFQVLKDSKENNLLPGVGVAFYTKFLFFLRPDLNGYILDQWTGKSYNLLMQGENHELGPIPFQGNVVQNQTTAEQYEHFCQTIDTLTIAYNLHHNTNLSGYQVEGKLFTAGGNWRAYLNQHYPLAGQAVPCNPDDNNPPPDNADQDQPNFPELDRFNTIDINISNNMDRLFWCYLAYLNYTNTWLDNAYRPLEDIVNEVPNLQFIDHNNLIQATFNFTKYAMINSAGARNYFQFEGGHNLHQEYTASINDPHRDYGNILQQYGNNQIRINPTYINNED